MIKKVSIFFSCLVILLSVLVVPALAQKQGGSASDDSIPEVDGTYDQPGHPGVKVRVFVHKEKGERVGQATPTLLACGLVDNNSSAVVAPAGWKLPSAVTYNLNPSSAPSSVGSVNVPAIAANGFADMTGAIGGKVSMTRGSNTNLVRSSYDGKNIIAWGRASSGTLGVTYIRYYVSSGIVVDVDTIMNNKYRWSWSNSTNCADTNSYDAENILTHEIGHWFGLDDEYAAAFVDNTMFGYGRLGEVKKNTLTTGDIAGINLIYP